MTTSNDPAQAFDKAVREVLKNSGYHGGDPDDFDPIADDEATHAAIRQAADTLAAERVRAELEGALKINDRYPGGTALLDYLNSRLYKFTLPAAEEPKQ